MAVFDQRLSITGKLVALVAEPPDLSDEISAWAGR